MSTDYVLYEKQSATCFHVYDSNWTGNAEHTGLFIQYLRDSVGPILDLSVTIHEHVADLEDEQRVRYREWTPEGVVWYDDCDERYDLIHDRWIPVPWKVYKDRIDSLLAGSPPPGKSTQVFFCEVNISPATVSGADDGETR